MQHRMALVGVALAVATTADAFAPHRMIAGAGFPEPRAKLVRRQRRASFNTRSAPRLDPARKGGRASVWLRRGRPLTR